MLLAMRRGSMYTRILYFYSNIAIFIERETHIRVLEEIS